MKRVKFVLLALVLLQVMIMSFCIPEETKALPKIKKMPVEKEVLEIPTEKEVYYGIASYYGERWNGRTTANMEIYNCNLLTCASPSLPFNTIIKVTNLDNCKTVTIRVNDRGPYKMDKDGRALKSLIPHPKRVLDLSKGSFKSIADLKVGLLNIKYEIVG